jgi:ribosomal protein L32
MDLFFSGLARRASEYKRNERRSQFSGVHEIAYRICLSYPMYKNKQVNERTANKREGDSLCPKGP